MNKFKKIVCLLTALVFAISFAACSKNEKSDDAAARTKSGKSKNSASDTQKENTSDASQNSASSAPIPSVPTPSAPASPDSPAAVPGDSETGGKYSDVEIYEGAEGNKYAKTESGVEVELTPENFETLMNEYMTVQGTGSEREKELLDQLQIFFYNMGDPALTQ